MHACQALKHEDMTSMWVHQPGNYGSMLSTQGCM